MGEEQVQRNELKLVLRTPTFLAAVNQPRWKTTWTLKFNAWNFERMAVEETKRTWR